MVLEGGTRSGAQVSHGVLEKSYTFCIGEGPWRCTAVLCFNDEVTEMCIGFGCGGEFLTMMKEKCKLSRRKHLLVVAFI